MARKGNPDPVEGADVEIGAIVKAKQLRFRQKPKTHVEFHGELHEPDGQGELQTTSGSERENLPDEVEPGVIYRDVRVRWRAAAGTRGAARPEKQIAQEGVEDEKQDEG